MEELNTYLYRKLSSTDCGKEEADRERTIAAMLVATPKTKQTQQLAFVVPFQYRLNRYGARKAPASAPQLTPIICAIKESFNSSYTMAMTALTAIKRATKIRMSRSVRCV